KTAYELFTSLEFRRVLFRSLAVNKLTGAPAAMYGFNDRGVVDVGKKADLNVIDFDNLTIQAPYTLADLPTGASRILQPSTGYLRSEERRVGKEGRSRR